MARLAATGLAAPRNEQERALVALYDRAYDSGWDDAINAAVKLIEEFPDQILHFYDRPGGPPGNCMRATTRQDLAQAVNELKETKTDGASSVSIQVPRDCAGEKA